ncbi:DNZ54_00345 family protein, partial [Escherichia coli]|uniref:DNZ54_00345 family protein n=1 Tax=Escherichia coli TaxID=562 RepID=UPI00207C4972
MALLIAAMVYPQGIFPVLAASGVWVACLLTWAVIPVALAALIKNGPLWQELRASLLKTINRTYANRSNAERAAKMQWERLQRGVASFSLQLAEGRADLYTEMPVKVSGFKQPIDDAEWTITTLTHTVSPDNGFTTSIELEVKIDDLEME